MQTDMIILSEYCRKTNLDPTFLLRLEEGGLLDIFVEEGEKYFPSTQLTDLEKYTRMYYDLSINVEGIDAIHHILNRMKQLQHEIDYLRSRLRLYDTDDFEIIE